MASRSIPSRFLRRTGIAHLVSLPLTTTTTGWVDLAAVGETKDGKGEIRLFRNLGPDGFKDVTTEVSLDKIQLKNPRAIITADYDNDGTTDFLITQNHGPAILLKNEGANKNHWLRLSLKGLNDNKSAIGTKLEVFSGGNRQKFEIAGSSGFLGENSTDIVVGLGESKDADIVRMLWPTGVLQDEIQIAGDKKQDFMEIDRRGSSCPTLFVWNGERYEFIADLLGAGVVRTSTQHAERDDVAALHVDGAGAEPVLLAQQRPVVLVGDDRVEVAEQQDPALAAAQGGAGQGAVGVARARAGQPLAGRRGRGQGARDGDALLGAVHVTRRRGHGHERLELALGARRDLRGLLGDPTAHAARSRHAIPQASPIRRTVDDRPAIRALGPRVRPAPVHLSTEEDSMNHRVALVAVAAAGAALAAPGMAAAQLPTPPLPAPPPLPLPLPLPPGSSADPVTGVVTTVTGVVLGVLDPVTGQLIPDPAAPPAAPEDPQAQGASGAAKPPATPAGAPGARSRGRRPAARRTPPRRGCSCASTGGPIRAPRGAPGFASSPVAARTAPPP